MAVDPKCDLNHCRLWVAAAGGGIWRNDDALSSNSSWTFVSDGFGTNAIGTLTYDAKSKTLYAGTGEPNASGDSESGVGIYASHDGGNRWDFLPGSAAPMNARSISAIVVDPNNPNTLYVGTTRGVRGVTSVTGGAVSLAPDAAAVGALEVDGRRQELQLRLGRARQPPRRDECRARQPRHAVRIGLPAGDLAVGERRLDLGAGVRDEGQG